MPHLLPGDLQRPAGPADAPTPLRRHARRRRGQRRAGRARVRDGAAVARLLRHGGAPRVDGGSGRSSSIAPRWRRPSTPGSPTTPSRRCSTRPRPSGSPTHRSPTARTSPTWSSISAHAGRSWPTPRTARRIPGRPSGWAPATPAGAASRHPAWESYSDRRRRRAAQPVRPAQPVRRRRHPALPVRGPARPRHDRRSGPGPLTGHMLALLGAEVIHLESPTRPDGARLVGGVPQTEDRYWERGPIFAALNTNKKSLTIDLSEPRGLDLVRRVIAHVRRRRRELHAAGARPAGPRLRVPARRAARSRSWCGCRVSGSTGPGATCRPSPS